MKVRNIGVCTLAQSGFCPVLTQILVPFKEQRELNKFNRSFIFYALLTTYAVVSGLMAFIAFGIDGAENRVFKILGGNALGCLGIVALCLLANIFFSNQDKQERKVREIERRAAQTLESLMWVCETYPKTDSRAHAHARAIIEETREGALKSKVEDLLILLAHEIASIERLRDETESDFSAVRELDEKHAVYKKHFHQILNGFQKAGVNVHTGHGYYYTEAAKVAEE